LTDPKAGFACGSMVRYVSFSQKFALCENFCEKEVNLPPCRRRQFVPGQGPRKSCHLLVIEK